MLAGRYRPANTPLAGPPRHNSMPSTARYQHAFFGYKHTNPTTFHHRTYIQISHNFQTNKTYKNYKTPKSLNFKKAHIEPLNSQNYGINNRNYNANSDV